MIVRFWNTKCLLLSIIVAVFVSDDISLDGSSVEDVEFSHLNSDDVPLIQNSQHFSQTKPIPLQQERNIGNLKGEANQSTSAGQANGSKSSGHLDLTVKTGGDSSGQVLMWVTMF